MSQNQGARKSQKARDLLKAYYGLGSPAISQKMEIDSKDFDAKEYLGGLFQKSSLSQMIQTDSKCLKEIKRLDSDRKNLVYENYSRFIRASESITSIKDNIQDISSELRSASVSIDSLASTLENIGTGLHENKTKLDLVYRKNATLKQFQFILELPRRLSQHITAGRYADAVRQYSYTSSLLEKYRQLSIFLNIENECHSIMQEAERSLWAQARDMNRPIKETIELLNIIMMLRKDSAYEAFKVLNETCFIKLHDILDQHAQTFRSRDLLSFGPLERFREIHEDFLPDFETLIVGFSEMVKLDQDTENQLSEIKALFLKQAESLFDEKYVRLIFEYAEVSWQDLSLTNLTAATSKLTLWLEELSTYDGLSGQSALMNCLQRARICICDWEKRLLEDAFTDVVEGFKRKVKESYPMTYPVEDPASLQSSLLACKNWLLDILLNKIRPKLELLLSSDLGFWQLSGTWGFFFRYLQTSFRRLWESLLVIPDPKSLLSSRLLLDLQSDVLQAIYDAYIGGLIRELAIPYSHQPSQSEVADDWLSDLFYLHDKALAYCQESMRSHTLVIGARFSLKLVNHICTHDWASCPEPTSPSSVFKDIVEDTFIIEANIGALFPPKHESEFSPDTISLNSEIRSPERRSSLALYHSPRQVASSIRSSFSTSGPMSTLPGLNRKLSAAVPQSNEIAHKQWQARINRLFSERIEIFGDVFYSLNGVLGAIFKIAIKASVEAIRLSAFGTNGFQQLQVDFAFLSQSIPSSITTDMAISSLIEEAVISGAKRCCLPKHMDPEILKAIVRNSS
ncbi:Vacuolar protein sorting-associated protein 51 [Entomophthora muscae]|uniref:Vacuolar protein sorting-associated protein 51 n=1 Tax=Entomophthora muscae TaxID=34485 RepID=A0ACC2U2V4_9FUNG|nr:Vacuolar protein sorting-associated protein 51 [Entomophthora muscae]